ncbi:hypothetical protein K2W90_01185 [Candidatus Babeliales bacterium]|nr:hypothetical protein [Candidatus Babeliales bacterium]
MKRVLLLAVCLFSFQAHAVMHAPADVNEAVVTLMQDKAFVEKCLTLYKNGAAPEEIIEQLSEEKKAHGGLGIVLGVAVAALGVLLCQYPEVLTTLCEGAGSLCTWLLNNVTTITDPISEGAGELSNFIQGGTLIEQACKGAQCAQEIVSNVVPSASSFIEYACDIAGTCYPYFNECAFTQGPAALVEVAQNGMSQAVGNTTLGLCPAEPFQAAMDVCRHSGFSFPDVWHCLSQFCPEGVEDCFSTFVLSSVNHAGLNPTDMVNSGA